MTLPKLTRPEFEKIKSIYADDSILWPTRSLLQHPDLVIECEGENGQRLPATDSQGDELLTVFRWKGSKIEVHKRDTLSTTDLGYSISIVGIEHSRDEKDLSSAAQVAAALRELPEGEYRREGRPRGASIQTQLEMLALAVMFWEWEDAEKKNTGRRTSQGDFCGQFDELDKPDELKALHQVTQRQLTDALSVARQTARNLQKNPT